MGRYTMSPSSTRLLVSVVVLVVGAFSLLACTSSDSSGGGDVTSCADSGETLRWGYYAYFEPVSFVDEDETPFRHYGFEADIASALEAIDGANLQFERVPIEAWDGIWLKSSTEFDVVGGGITILASRTMDDSGATKVAFTNGHIAFRQSLLTRSEDADGLNSYDSLTSDVRVGALAGTTGEARMLQLVGLADDDGVLVAGATVETPSGDVVADGSSSYFITAAETSPEFHGRTMMRPPSDDYPTVVYLGYELGEIELLDALEAGEIDGVARGEIGNSDAAIASDGALSVAMRDSESEWGGLTVASDKSELLSCLNEHIDYLTDNRNIGYAEWLADPQVFMNRATAR